MSHPAVSPTVTTGPGLHAPPGPLLNGGPSSALNGGHTRSPRPTPLTSSSSTLSKLANANEQTWLLIGRCAEQMLSLDMALSAYESALRHNPHSLAGLSNLAGIFRVKENYPKAIEYFQRVLAIQEENGEVWSALGHCYLMQDDLQKAYSAYQQALYLLPNPKEDPKLWYGIGILYDRYGSLDHAEEAFGSVLKMDRDFDKANEILFRLGIIYKQQGKYPQSLNCFEKILRYPPSPLAHADIWFQIGHVYEMEGDQLRAKEAYERVVGDNPGHAKVLQQLGWLYHQDASSFQNQDRAITYLTKSLEADSSDAQSWYLLGRAYMAGQKYNKAYEAYQQAVYRDGRNPTFWCSIGVLYFQINQFRDALDAYSRAIRINPYISEVWFDLGSLYESCNNQLGDAIDAYARAAELDPVNQVISERLALLREAQRTGGGVNGHASGALGHPPNPQDVHPTAYASAVVPPGPPRGFELAVSANGGPSAPSSGALDRGQLDRDRLGPIDRPSERERERLGPPPLLLSRSGDDERERMLAPMDVERVGRDLGGPGPRDNGRPPSRDLGPRDFGGEGGLRGPGLLLHHPVARSVSGDEPPRSLTLSNGSMTNGDRTLPERGLPPRSRQMSPPTHPLLVPRSPRPYSSRDIRMRSPSVERRGEERGPGMRDGPGPRGDIRSPSLSRDRGPPPLPGPSGFYPRRGDRELPMSHREREERAAREHLDREMPPRDRDPSRELPSRSDRELPSRGDRELASRGDRELPSRGDRELPSRGDRELPSRGDRELPSRGERELPSRDRDMPPRDLHSRELPHREPPRDRDIREPPHRPGDSLRDREIQRERDREQRYASMMMGQRWGERGGERGPPGPPGDWVRPPSRPGAGPREASGSPSSSEEKQKRKREHEEGDEARKRKRHSHNLSIPGPPSASSSGPSSGPMSAVPTPNIPSNYRLVAGAGYNDLENNNNGNKPPSRVTDDDYDEPGVAAALMGLAASGPTRRQVTPPAPSTRPSPIPFRTQGNVSPPGSRTSPVGYEERERKKSGSPAEPGAAPISPVHVVLPPHPRPVGVREDSRMSDPGRPRADSSSGRREESKPRDEVKVERRSPSPPSRRSSSGQSNRDRPRSPSASRRTDSPRDHRSPPSRRSPPSASRRSPPPSGSRRTDSPRDQRSPRDHSRAPSSRGSQRSLRSPTYARED